MGVCGRGVLVINTDADHADHKKVSLLVGKLNDESPTAASRASNGVGTDAGFGDVFDMVISPDKTRLYLTCPMGASTNMALRWVNIDESSNEYRRAGQIIDATGHPFGANEGLWQLSLWTADLLILTNGDNSNQIWTLDISQLVSGPWTVDGSSATMACGAEGCKSCTSAEWLPATWDSSDICLRGADADSRHSLNGGDCTPGGQGTGSMGQQVYVAGLAAPRSLTSEFYFFTSSCDKNTGLVGATFNPPCLIRNRLANVDLADHLLTDVLNRREDCGMRIRARCESMCKSMCESMRESMCEPKE
eukprot:CAMPEP_0174753172 /NCGR_PEP_ID=MMETSP1094-20130205/103525_1 /TAXON_ID=156173 /ORGANISM="Chrysochromulina brevifilum, Strain UTEX LB 985" /LENGTH=304 /DNA_ID=CAMNT_0015958905 /DNA_START=54 /DNA_END=969 /DNA_ORIENTATION=-